MVAHNIHMFSFTDNDQLVVHLPGSIVGTKRSTSDLKNLNAFLQQKTEQSSHTEPLHVKHIKDRYNIWGESQITTFFLKKMLRKAGYIICDSPGKAPLCCTTRSQGPTVLNFRWK